MEERREELRQQDLQRRPPKASSIFRRGMDNSFANIRGFLQNLLSNIEIIQTNVGQSFDYPHGIFEDEIYIEYGNFMNYFIRKHLSNQYDTDINDIAVTVVLNEWNVYFDDPNSKSYISDHYEIFKNPQNNAMDILESIKIVSQAYSATYDKNKVRIVEIDSEDEALLEIISYFESLPFENVNLTPNLDCEYFKAVPDFIFDNGTEKVLYNIKTSRNDNISPEDFYILIAYAFGYYKNTNGEKNINTFIIYNPLLGHEHKIIMKNIDFEEFERCIDSDYVNKYGQNWRQIQN